jgi:glycosyltransferase involved in cell wall biosynthesis
MVPAVKGDRRMEVPRGRVVMLVDNTVTGDSRVQKVATSAAAAGWEVTLIGRSPTTGRAYHRLGGAVVRLVPMPQPPHHWRHELRRAWLRAPWAYPPTGIAELRTRTVKAWRADLRVRRAQLDLDRRATPDRILRRRERWLRLELLAARVVGRWVRVRAGALVRTRRRSRLGARWDRAWAALWRATRGTRSWRRLEPGLWDYELAYGPLIDRLEPDLIHAHDFRMLGVAARAVLRARAAGRAVKLVWDAHEYLPGIAPWSDAPRWLPANLAHEREYAPYADAVITVSDRLAELLQHDHGLPVRPAVVLNAPALRAPAGAAEGPAPPSVRAACGLDAGVPLLVYSGLASSRRGIDVMVGALPDLPGVHVALVVHRPNSPHVAEVLRLARALGVADRVHLLPYVEHWQVVTFLASADVGVIPVQRFGNYEVSLTTKFYEYSHARLPIVVSDVRTMAATVRATGQGEVFRAGDVADYVRAVRTVLDRPDRYRAAYDDPDLLAGWTWAAQAQVLDGVYRRLLDPSVPGVADGPEPAWDGDRAATVAPRRVDATMVDTPTR